MRSRLALLGVLLASSSGGAAADERPGVEHTSSVARFDDSAESSAPDATPHQRRATRSIARFEPVSPSDLSRSTPGRRPRPVERPRPRAVAAFPDLREASPDRDPALDLLETNPYTLWLARLGAAANAEDPLLESPYTEALRWANPYTEALRWASPYTEELLRNPYTELLPKSER